MDRITYLVGAGASVNALPLTLEIPFRLGVLEEYIRTNITITGAEAYADDIKGLRLQLSAYNTIDGYARTLSQNKVNAENRPSLAKLKSILCGLFMFEQLWKEKRLWDLGEDGAEYNDSTYSRIERTIDPRYKSFFAKVLNGTRLDERIKIISWNYDIQLEIALENNLGFKYDQLDQSCTIYPHPSGPRIGGNLLVDIKGVYSHQIVKLNGTAGIFFRGNVFHNIYLDQKESFEDLFQTILEVHKENVRYEKYNPYLRFAWEQDELTMKAIEYAKAIIQNTDILVVIGYSFPDFNRPIDYQIFQENRLQQVFLQMPESDLDTVKYNMETSFDRGKISRAKHIKNLNEFFIPSQFIPNYQ